MSKPFFCMGVVIGSVIATAIAPPFFLPESAIARPLPTFPSAPVLRLNTGVPLCYIQFQGSSAIDVSRVCGKNPGEAPKSKTPVTVSSDTAPVFDPTVMNPSTTGQCNFVDSNGKPCPQK